MGIKAHYLLNKAKEKFYPYAHADATFDRNGKKVGVRLDEMDAGMNTHTSDTTVHITSTERTNWNDANSKKHTHSNKSILDGITSALITNWNNAVTHISDTVKHITSTERTNWNAAKTHSDSAHAPSNAEANQNAFSNVKVGTTTVAADSKTDTLELVGSNVTLTPDATNDKVTIGITKENVTTALGYTPPTTNVDRKYCMVGSNTANTSGWYKVASQTMAATNDTNITFAVTSTYKNYFSGILQLQVRSETSSVTCHKLVWLVKNGFTASDVICVVSGMTYTIYVKQNSTQYGRIMFEVLSESSHSGATSGITLHNSTAPESTAPTATVTAVDGGSVYYANSAGNANTATTLSKWTTTSPNTTLNRWCKVASVTLDVTYEDYSAIIIANETEVAHGCLVMEWQCSTGASATTFASNTLRYLTGTGRMFAEFKKVFYVEHIINEKNITFNLWCQPLASYQTFSFSMLAEHCKHTQNKKCTRYTNPAYITTALTGVKADYVGNPWCEDIKSSRDTGTYIKGNQGDAIINSTAAAGRYVALDKLNSTNGVFVDAVHQDKRLLLYTSKETVEAGTNSPTKSLTLLNEAGNSTFPGTVTASAFSGNASSATKWATGRSINGVTVDGTANRFNYGTCSTAAATVEKAVTCAGFGLMTGSRIAVKFTVTNTASNPTLNVNSTGAKAIMYRGSAINAAYLEANRIYEFVYDGTDWEVVGDLNTNTIYTHPTTSGNKHIPSGGASGQILRWSADGTAVWGNDNNTTYGVATSSTLGLVKSGTDITVDSSGNVSVNDDSHNHTISNVDGLQTALDGKASSSHGTHVTYSTTAPVMDGTASVGSASTVARSDHKHPSDTSKVSTTRTINNKALSSNITLSASDIKANDTNTLEYKVGAINGITSDTSADADDIAISTKAFNNALGGLTFGQDAEGNWGYIPSGADTVTPFKKGGTELVLLKSGVTHATSTTYVNVDCTSIPGYGSMTVDDFVVVPTSVYVNCTDSLDGNGNAILLSGQKTATLSTTYNASTGKLKISNMTAEISKTQEGKTVHAYVQLKCKVYYKQ